MGKVLLKGMTYVGTFCLMFVSLVFITTMVGVDIRLALELAALQAMLLGGLVLLIAIMVAQIVLPFAIGCLLGYCILLLIHVYKRRRAGD